MIHAMMDLITYDACGKEIDKSKYILTDEEFAKLCKPAKSILPY